MYMYHSTGTLAHAEAPHVLTYISFRIHPPEGYSVHGIAPTTYSYPPPDVAVLRYSSTAAVPQLYISTAVL